MIMEEMARSHYALKVEASADYSRQLNGSRKNFFSTKHIKSITA